MTPMRAVSVRLAFATAATALLSLAGCKQQSAFPVQGVALQGKVHGGQQPVTGAAIYLYVAGSTGTGSASSSLLVSGPNTTKDSSGNYYATTDGNGGFSITGDYTCPSGDTQVYIVAVGGNPGLASGTNNAALTMMAPLGSCGLLKPSTFITINEVTTVGSVAALYPDMVSYSAIGTASGATEDLANLFNVATEYINSATGLAPGPNLPSGYYASSNEIDSLADSIATCVNSAGGLAGDGSPCGTLFQAATPPSGTAPTDTLGALIDILNHPTNNVSTIYGLANSTAPFAPSLGSAPSDWTLPILQLPIAPNFLPIGGTYVNSQTVSITSPTPGVTIYYTTNGATPTSSSSVYSTPLTVSANETLKAIAVSTRVGSTSPSSASYAITGAAATPIILPAAGSYTSPQLVTIASPTLDATTIYYTVDGTTPTTSSALYTGGLSISSSTTVKAIAVAGASTSAAASAAYTIQSGSGTIYTFAGGPQDNGDGGLATSASVAPYATVFDASGNLYIADYNGNRIRKISAATGIITTVAGTGFAGYNGDNIAATTAQVNNPTSIAIDGSGNLYICDYRNNRIRMVSASTGLITTVAGTGTAGFTDNIAANTAAINGPRGVALDASGNLYIADTSNNRIRKVTAGTGVISTIVGSTSGFTGDGGLATAAKLSSPYALTFDASGNLYIVDEGNSRVREVSAATGNINTVAGNGGFTAETDNVIATATPLSVPHNIAVDLEGNLYISDYGHYRIRKVTAATGIITSVAGIGTIGYNGDNIAATTAKINTTYGVAVDGSGNLYICDVGNFRLREVSAATGNISTIAGIGTATVLGDGGPATSAYIFSPAGVATASNGDVYIADSGNNRVRKVSAANGVITTVAGTGAGGFSGDTMAATSAELSNPLGVALDASGNLYIADNGNNRIRMVSASTGIITTVAGNGTAGYTADNVAATSSELNGPVRVAVDGSGNFYIADQDNERVRKVTVSTGIITTVAGNGTGGFAGDNGPAASAELFFPEGIALDSSGNLYIADLFNSRIRMVAAASGTITTVAGGGTGAFKDGVTATSAVLSSPSDVTVDGAGNLYISDGYDYRVRKVTASTGVISTVVGNGTSGYTGDGGAATAAEINGQAGLAFDSKGRLYVADGYNNAVRVVYP